jgi:uncharacterized repeat protein (TIGR03803 family)
MSSLKSKRHIAKVLIGLAMGMGAGVAWAQTDVKFATVHSFDGADGAGSSAPLVQATNGDLYGTTPSAANGFGTVFKMGLLGQLTTLYNFCSQSGCPDGAEPIAGLVQATNGDFYGTTDFGGSNAFCPPVFLGLACGTIFKITPDGTLTTLYRFCSQPSCVDGELPIYGLVQAANGDLYGTTAGGGAAGNGTIFKITASGTFTTLYSFCTSASCTDGVFPSAALTQGRDGNLYGITGGGARGTIFKITPAGKFTLLYTFCSQSNCADGYGPSGPLVQAANGNFYGTTVYGGVNNGGMPPGYGTIFEITPSGQLTTIYTFCKQSGCPDGDLPDSGLIPASDGNFYGTTLYGGANPSPITAGGSGTIFRLSPSGTLTTVYNFCAQANCADGHTPFAPLVQDSLGVIYGTTSSGGANDDGTVFALSTGAPPFVTTRPTIGVAGEIVTILGYGLKTATSVTFNGTPATILYTAPTVIYASVPAGATTGNVQVVTATGTLTSNVNFEVVP